MSKFTFTAALILAAGIASQASARSIETEYGALVGHWTCRVTEAGKPDTQTKVSFELVYGNQVLREIVTGGQQGEFLTTYDKRSDSFKGVGVGSWGGYVVWENPGTTNGKSTEIGYLFGAGKMTAVSRTEWESVSATHYIIRDFQMDNTPADTEDCTKDA